MYGAHRFGYEFPRHEYALTPKGRIVPCGVASVYAGGFAADKRSM
jgi:hypothetical protein